MTSQPHTPGTPPPGCPAHPGAVPVYMPRFQRDPSQMYRDMRREHGTVAPILLDGDIPAWLVLGYREVHYVTANSDLFARDSRRWNAWEHIPADWPLMPYVGYQPSLMFAEGAEHQRRAGAISEFLSGVDQLELHKYSEKVADEMIDAFVGRGEAELMAEYATQVPIRVMAMLFGFDEDEIPHLVRDVAASLEDVEPMAAYQRVVERMAALLQRSRANPGHDLPSHLLAHPAGLTDDEITKDLLVVLAAAHQPTANWIGNTLRLMLTDPRFAVTLSGGRRSVGQALNEVLWEDTPTQNFIGRWATRNTQLGGQRIQAGDLLVLSFAAANTDPQVRPDFSEGSRGNQAHMSFSHGEHSCLYPGPEIAEIIARATVEVLLDRLPDVALAVEPEEVRWQASLWMRGPVSVPVEFSPAYVAGDAGF